ncbi:MAG: MBL fold metallo-hydrolase [Alphaproteobacteria bacterium]|nr:MBL fold metallo-hydrolase [Alphaproteobacteria bacterium]
MNRKWVLGAAIAVGLPVLACMGWMGSIFSSFPAMQGARIDGGSFLGVETGGAYAWVVPTATGVILVDAGIDPAAAALLAEIGDRPVHAVLITHGHFDHVAGLAGLDEPVAWIGAADLPLATGEALPSGTMPWIFSRLMGPPAASPSLKPLEASSLTIDGTEVRAIAMPGHTGGSTSWVIGDTVFTGDAAFGHPDHIEPAHSAFCDDIGQARQSLRALEGVADRLADGHAGLHEGLQARLRH